MQVRTARAPASTSVPWRRLARSCSSTTRFAPSPSGDLVVRWGISLTGIRRYLTPKCKPQPKKIVGNLEIWALRPTCGSVLHSSCCSSVQDRKMFQGSLVLEQNCPSERETVFKGHFSLQSGCGDMSTFQRQACKPLRSGSRAGNVACPSPHCSFIRWHSYRTKVWWQD